MDEDSRNGIPPDSSAELAIENLTKRVVWTTDTTECHSCGSTVELRSDHYYATPEADDESTSDEVVFCSRACAESYFRSTSSDSTRFSSNSR